MNPEELKNIWSQQPATSAAVVRLTPEVIWRLAGESMRFKRTIFWRDVREWLATILLAGGFLYIAFRDDHIHWPMIAAAVIVCLPMTYVALRRPKRPIPETAAQLGDHLRASIAEVRYQLELLRSVARWYLAPIAVSGAIFLLDGFFTAPAPSGKRFLLIPPFLFGAFVIAAVFYAVWKLNQFTARKHLEPRLRQLEETLAELGD